MGPQERGKEKVPEVRCCGMVPGSQVFLLQHQKNRTWIIAGAPPLLSVNPHGSQCMLLFLWPFPLLLRCLAALKPAQHRRPEGAPTEASLHFLLPE